MTILALVMLLPAAAMADYSYQIVDPTEQYSVDFEFTRPVSDAVGGNINDIIGNVSGGLGVDINNNGLALFIHDTDRSCDVENGKKDWMARPFVWDATTNDKATGYDAFDVYPIRSVYDINNVNKISGYYMDDSVSCTESPIDIPFILSKDAADVTLLAQPEVNRYNFANKMMLNDAGMVSTNIGPVPDYFEPKLNYFWDSTVATPPTTVPYIYKGGEHNHPMAVNEHDIVVGWANPILHDLSCMRAYAFDFTTQKMTDLPLDVIDGEMSGTYIADMGAYELTLTFTPDTGYDGIPPGTYAVATNADGITLDDGTNTYYLNPVEEDPESIAGTWQMADDSGNLLEWVYLFDDENNFRITPLVSVCIAYGINESNTIVGGYTRTDSETGDIIEYAALAWKYNDTTEQWDDPVILPQYSDPANPGIQYYSSCVDIADTGKIVGGAGEMLSKDGVPVGGDGFPVVWEYDDVSGEWAAPVLLASQVTGLSESGLSLGYNFLELGETFLPSANGDVLAIASGVLALEKLNGIRMSDDGSWILMEALADETREVTLVGGYQEAVAGELTLTFDDDDIMDWYVGDPMLLHLPATDISYTIVDDSHMTLTVNGVDYQAVMVENGNIGLEGDITGEWSVTDTAETFLYTMTFDETGGFDVSVALDQTAVPLKRLVPIVLSEDTQPACCEEDNSGEIDIAPASVSLDDVVTVPIRFQGAPNDVNAMYFIVTYVAEDGATLDLIDFEPDPVLMNGWTYVTNQLADGSVIVVAVDGHPPNNTIPIGTNGVIGYLKYTISDIQCVSFELQDLDGKIAGWTDSRGCLLDDGVVNGDANQNGVLEVLDAICLFQKIFDGDCATDCNMPCDQVLCDVTQDGMCTADDVECVMLALALDGSEACSARLIDFWDLD